MKLNYVRELIIYLEGLGRDRMLIMDLDGNTFSLTTDHIKLWDETSDDSPVAFFAPLDWE